MLAGRHGVCVFMHAHEQKDGVPSCSQLCCLLGLFVCPDAGSVEVGEAQGAGDGAVLQDAAS